MNRVAWMFVLFIAPICCCLGAALQNEAADFVVRVPNVEERAQDFIILTPLPTPTPFGGGADGGGSGSTGAATGSERDTDGESGSDNNDGPAGSGGGPIPAGQSTPLTPDQPTPATSPTPNASPTVGAATQTSVASPTQPPATVVPTNQPPATSPPADDGDDDERSDVDDNNNDNDDDPPPPTTPPPPPPPPTATPLTPTATPVLPTATPPTATPLPVISFETVLLSVVESDGPVAVNVLLDKAVDQAVSVSFTSADGTALAGQDYIAVAGSLTIPAGQTTQSISLPIVDDPDGGERPDESLTLTLTAPIGAILGSSLATITIVDDDNFVVNTTADNDDGACTLSHCSLREAINISNGTIGRNGILFDIPGGGPHTISPGSPLPVVADPVIIDGYSQPGAVANSLSGGSNAVLLIEIEGSGLAGLNQAGLTLAADDSLLRGLVINRFSGPGIFLTGSNNHLTGCYVGSDVSGSLDRGNGSDGILIGSPASGNTIGGATPAEQNVISGNDRNGLTFDQTGGNLVLGNIIGLNRQGTAGLGNSEAGIGIFRGNGNRIGGSTTGEGNIIAANGTNGLELNGAQTSNTIIRGNIIGTEAGGTVDLGNGRSGLLSFNGATNNTVGGAGPETANLFAYNGQGINHQGGTLSVGYTTLRHHSSLDNGGGINNSGVMTVTNSLIMSNTALCVGCGGGGIYNTGRLNLADSRVSGNQAGDDGGGLANVDGQVVIERSLISNNEAPLGGGVGHGGSSATKQMTVVDSTLTGNRAGVDGGGLWSDTGGTLTLTGSTVSTNTAAGRGGGIFSNLSLSLTNSTLSRNTAGIEGDDLFNTGPASILQSTVYNSNVATTQPLFGPTTTVGSGGTEPIFVTSADFNGDGFADLVVANNFSDDVTVLLGDGSGGFGLTTTVSTGGGVGNGPTAVAVADFNGDGRLDLAVTNPEPDDYTILFGDGAGNFGASPPVDLFNGPISVATGDFDGDGDFDLAVANDLSDDVKILLNDGSGGFVELSTPVAAGNEPHAVITADFNGDGDLDLAVANIASNDVTIMLGDGTGGFAPTDVLAGTEPFGVAVADFNGDGFLDLAVANYISNDITILPGDGSGGFGTPTTVAVGNGPTSVTTADFNGDGRFDLAVTNELSDDVTILLGDGSGGFGMPLTVTVGSQPYSVAAADFNGDGRLDLAVTNLGSDDVSILLNQGSGQGVVNDGGTLTLQNSIVDSCRLNSGAILSNGYNLTGSTSCAPFLTDSTDTTGSDPLLGPLQDNGGPTATHALQQPSSPALDRIPPGVSGCGTTVTTDQRGVVRPQGGGCDVGAFEAQ